MPEVASVDILDQELMGKGFGQALYDAVEEAYKITLKASDNLSYDGFKLWQRRDPNQVRGSLYHFRDALIGARVDHPEASGVIARVHHETVSIEKEGLSRPLRKSHLKELGLIPLDDVELDRWMDGNAVKTASGGALKVFHGTDEAFDHFRDRPTYFSGSQDYGYIRQKPKIYECYISLKSPLFVDKTSDIEALRSFPERVESLKRLGYDGVIYADPQDLTKGATGWGNDHSQFLVFHAEQILKAELYPGLHAHFSADHQSTSSKSKPVIEVNGQPKTFFHGTGNFFREFLETKDIGYHFGSKRAALERIGGGKPEIEVEFAEPTAIQKTCAKIASAETPTSAIDQAYYLLMRKLDSPKPGLYDVLKGMSHDEHLEVIESYADKLDSESFLKRAEAGAMKPKWRVLVDDQEVGAFDSKKTAQAYSHQVSQSFIKRVNLRIANPIRLPDLGIWTAADIAEAACLSPEKIDAIFDSGHCKEDWYRQIKHELKAMGYDGIVYENAVEDKGSDSYIAFDRDQIVHIDPIEPPHSFEQKSKKASPAQLESLGI